MCRAAIYGKLLFLVIFVCAQNDLISFLEVHFGHISLPVKFHCQIKCILEDIEDFRYWQQGTETLNSVLKALEAPDEVKNLGDKRLRRSSL